MIRCTIFIFKYEHLLVDTEHLLVDKEYLYRYGIRNICHFLTSKILFDKSSPFIGKESLWQQNIELLMSDIVF